MSGKINLSGKLQMGNSLIFFGEQTLAQDELRIKMLNTGVRPLSSTGKEVKLILGDITYNNWSGSAVTSVNNYFGQDIRNWTYAFNDLLRSDQNLAGTYNMTVSGNDTIIIKRKINNARIPAPAYLWQADNLGYATTIITVNSGCTYTDDEGTDQGQYLKIFLDSTTYDVWLRPSRMAGPGVDGFTVWTTSFVAQEIAKVINAGGTHTATVDNSVVTVVAEVAETQAATTRQYPNPFMHYSNTWTYMGGQDFETYIATRTQGLTFTPGASEHPITIFFTPPDPITPLWWLDSINNAVASHPHWGPYKADGRIIVRDSPYGYGWTLEYVPTGGESGTAAAPSGWYWSTTNYQPNPNETQYEITSFTDGTSTPKIEHSDVLVRGKSPA